MEALQLMLQKAALPMYVGFAAAFTLSKFSEWSVRTKLRAAYVYHLILLLGSVLAISPLGWGMQLQHGVLTAFGVGFSMAQWRLATTKLARVGPALLFLLYWAVLWLLFRGELISAFRHLSGDDI